MNMEREIEISQVGVAPARIGLNQVQPCDSLAKTGAAIGVDHRNGINEPVIAIAESTGRSMPSGRRRAATEST